MVRLNPTFHTLPARCLALFLIAIAAATALTAQTALQARVAARPLTNDDITGYKLAATTQRSAGLTTVGLGQPVYLEAAVSNAVPAEEISAVVWTVTKKPAGSVGWLEDSPLGSNVPLYEPSDRQISRVVGRILLRPDVVGLYTVKASIVTATSGVTDVTLNITAATYLGITACALCHSGGPAGTKWSMVESWSRTAHAEIFKDGIDGLASSYYGVGCLGCHTVGYDASPRAINGGFDDVAGQLKWTFPKALKAGNWDALPAALKNLGNIQCENCHGPGSLHVSSGGDSRLISVSFGSGVCGQCHNAGSHHIKTAEWNASPHAVPTREPSGAGREACVGCHTGTGFVGKLQGAKTIDTAYTPINCQTCHEAHGRTNPATNKHLLRTLASVKLMDGTVVENGGNGTLCMNCHQSRRKAVDYVATTPGSAHFGPHIGPQADMLAGTNGIAYGLSIPSSAHGAVVKDTCVGCHMQAVETTKASFLHAGGHTFKPSWKDGSNPKVELVGKCQSCHGPRVTSFDFPLLDYDDEGRIEGVQTEVQQLLDKLALLLPPVGQAKTSLAIDSTWNRQQLQAAYNWLFVKNDGSLGVHNMAYAVGLLKASIADMSATANK